MIRWAACSSAWPASTPLISSASLKPDLPKLGGWGERALGFFHLGTGFWLMYLVFAVVLNFVLNYALPL